MRLLRKTHKDCFADVETMLPKLCDIFGINYDIGSFSDYEDSFCYSNKEEDHYILESKIGLIDVHLEQYEGYFYVTIESSGKPFKLAKEYLLKIMEETKLTHTKPS